MVEENHVTLLWKIENFSYCVQEQPEYLESPEFYVNSLTESLWKLRLYPRGIGTDNEVKVFLLNISYKENCALFINYEISFLSEGGSVLHKQKIDRKVYIWNGEMYGILSYPAIDELLPQNMLTVQCRIWKSKKNLLYSINYFARTHIGLQRRSFHWTVRKFSKLEINKKKIHMFIMDKQQPTFFTAMFFSNYGVWQTSIEFEIKQVTKNISKLFATCKISVLDVKGKVVKSMEGSYRFKPEDSIWRFPRFLTKHEVRANPELMVGDSLNLFFDLTFTTGIMYSNLESISSMSTSVQKSPVNMNSIAEVLQSISSNKLQSPPDDKSGRESLSPLQMDLLYLCTNETLSDFELRAGSMSFPVHKSVLAARSPVFKDMFTSGMRERANNFIYIPDLDGKTLKRLLVFIYAGYFEELDWTNAAKLYYAADKYNIHSLKQKCCTCLTNGIVGSNVCEILILADQHNDERLKSSVYDFIKSNYKDFIHSAEWKQFLFYNKTLGDRTLQLIYSKKPDRLL